jgi:competence protein ComEC
VSEHVSLATRLDLRLVVPAVTTWLTAALAVGGVAGWIAPVLAVVAGMLLAGSWWLGPRRMRSGFLSARLSARATDAVSPALAVGAVSLALAALVCAIVGVQAAARSPSVLVDAASAGRHTVATLVTTAAPADGRVAARLERVQIGSRASGVSTPVLVFLAEAGEVAVTARSERELGIGTTIELDGRLLATDPGDDVAFLFFAESEPRILAQPDWFLEWGNRLRSRFSAAAAALPGDGGDLLPGLAIGDTSAVDESLDAAMKASSLSHLTAVSGANCAIVVGLVMAAGAAVGIPRGFRVATSMLVLLAFVVLVTPQPSVLRAAVMAALVLIALARGRPIRGVPVLAVAVLLLVLVDPWLARNYGFVLSVLATGALVVLVRPLAARIGRFLPAPLAVVIAVPLAAQLACQPVLILLNSTIPIYGVVANLLAEPAAPVATVLGLLACVLLPLVPPLGEVIAALAWVPASWIAAVAHYFPTLPGARVPWLAGAAGAVLLAVLTVLAIGAVLLRSGRTRRAAAFLCVLLVVATAAGSLATAITQRLSQPPDWQIAACDIGQGDAVLVRSAGEVALIDTGPDPAALTSCLDTLGISRIDLLVLTHYDLDHVGGVDAVTGMVTSALVGPTDGIDDVRLRDSLSAGGAVVAQGSRGMTGLLGDLRWTLLWPRYPLSGVEPGNEASLTLTFRPAGNCVDGCLSSLFLGDLGQESQALVLAAGPVPKVDVVKVAHHGSRDQEPRIYEAASATVGIVSVGADNTYGHPTGEALEMLKAAGTTPVRTDLRGTVLVSPGSEPGEVDIWGSG